MQQADARNIRTQRADGLPNVFVARDRSGRERDVPVRRCPDTGGLLVEISFVHWSTVPNGRSHVLVLPDLETYLAFEAAIGDRSIVPFVVCAASSIDTLPLEWRDACNWMFDDVTVLADEVLTPNPLISLLADTYGIAAGVATPPCPEGWRAWAGARRRTFEDLDALTRAARPLADFRTTDEVPDLRSLDAEARLCRVVASGAGDRARPMIIRSDRTAAAVRIASGAAVAVAGIACDPGGSWAADYLRSRPFHAEVVGRRLAALIEGHLLLDAGSARRLAAFIGLTYLYQAFDQLPLLVVRGGDGPARLVARRLLTQLCHGGQPVTRLRAAHMARIADASEGTLVIEEPGALCGPSGGTELGRFLESGLVRDCSPFTAVSRRKGVRRLETFGPKVVVAASASVGGLACEGAVVELATLGSARPFVGGDQVAGLRDDLLRWSMAAVADAVYAGTCGAGHGTGLITMVDAILFPGEGSIDAEASAPNPAFGHADGNPSELLRTAFERCRGTGYVSMVQILLELRLRGARDDSLTPERVGRWLAVHPEIDNGGDATRRRLYGQVSRIYRLRSEGVRADGDPIAAFGFCRDGPCSECPYAGVCDATFPGMRSRKARA